jgi:adenine-specific DNA methylase
MTQYSLDSLTPEFLGRGFQYIEQGIEAKGHTPVYKMHKYFARRPHNVFRYLVESYTKPGDIILDCFCGGGVTLFEALSLGRKAIAVDINPLATLISTCQTTPVPIVDFQTIMTEILSEVQRIAQRYFRTKCRKCGRPADVRWYELAHTAICPAPECHQETPLANRYKAMHNSEVVNGRYLCRRCGHEFAAIDAERVGYELLSVTYKCQCTGGRQTSEADKEDVALMEEVEQGFDELIGRHDLWYPQDEIPAMWDRQLEDCLHRKSIRRFADLFTKRSLFFNAYLLKLFQRYRTVACPELYETLLFTFSAILRYTNIMTFSTGNWMDGRPVAWAKHAYWTPYQFVEVNPYEYVEKRYKAVVAGLKFQKKHLIDVKRVENFPELESGKGTHIVWTASSAHLAIPDESIMAVITDPPYGSNVQYGELSSFWLVWLQKDLPLNNDLLSLDDEIVVQRKARNKDYDYYFNGLRDVFRECFRVLQSNGVLVFTFNSKVLKTWFYVVRAAMEAGFHLDARGVIYQEPIEDYRNTAHTRYAGSLHGDFIYTFRKTKGIDEDHLTDLHVLDTDHLREVIRATAVEYLSSNGAATTNELHVYIMTRLIPMISNAATAPEEFARVSELLSTGELDDFLREYLELGESDRMWHLRRNDPRQSVHTPLHHASE